MTALLEVTNLVKHYPIRRRLLGPRERLIVRAVDGVSLKVNRGETVALVGESGCGKSTMARLLLRLIEPTSGSIRFDGEDITSHSGATLRGLRRRMQIVFQDPFSSLNPRMRTREIIEEPLLVHGIGDRRSRRETAEELLRLVGLHPAQAEQLPAQFSGGQRQRIGIARALALKPELIVCDEPVSALDVSIQAQVVNLLADLQARFHLTYLFIAHDLAVVKHMADQVAVMYLGKIVEMAPKRQLFADPRHPYTRTLLASVPRPDPHLPRQRQPAEAEMPSPMAVPSGCRFHTRCPFVVDICRQVEPALEMVGEGQATACHRWRELAPSPAPESQRKMATATDMRLELFGKRREYLQRVGASMSGPSAAVADSPIDFARETRQ